MKYIDGDEDNDSKLKSQRGICFEEIQTALEEGNLIDDLPHPNKIRYRNQRLFIIEFNHYAYVVPYVEDNKKIFLKSIIPSRKATKKYIKEK